MKNLICVCGPRGAGKEVTTNAILSSAYGSNLRRVVPFTTRAKREGETHGKEYYFITPEEHRNLPSASLVYSVQIGTGENCYFSGTLDSEFRRHDNGIIDITVEGARTLVSHAHKALLLFIYASPEERHGRIMRRQGLSSDEAWALMQNEPSPGSPDTVHELYPEFTILENHDGVSVENILTPVYEFLLGAPVHI